MAEDHISRDEHRADMTELRSEFKEEIAGLRQEITTLTKTMEANQQTMLLRFEQADQRHSDLLAMMNQRFDQVDQRFNQMEQQRQEDRQVMLQQFQQVDQRHSDLLAAMNQRFDQVEQQRQTDRQEINQRFAQHETRLGSMENWMRTTFVTLALVAVGVAAQLFYTLMRLGLKPPTGGP
ncbi:MAG: hypothetical protein ETSY1_21480 [Candidatus Entotheonella factor]|uniref:Uncharacterized protein n=1 Tax=Entotheonella factor TaxID=1429438 RepID=W4LIJ2_ENTF1|nr:MAG: hypothetical protein ETSY1_21480 [Candidatus Entotheonella factor]